MAGTSLQLSSFGQIQYEWQQSSQCYGILRDATQSGSMQKMCLWAGSCYNASGVSEGSASCGYGKLSEKDATYSLALPVHVHDEDGAFVALLRACTKKKDLHRGSRIHGDIVKRGLVEKCSDALVTMYAKCGELEKADALLEKHKSRDVITWTALIAGYAREGQAYNALDCFGRMRREGIVPDGFTYACVLRACGILGAADEGKKIHDEIVRQGLLVNDVVLGTAIVDMYAKCGALARAESVLEELPSRDVVSWGAVITGYAQQGQGERALNCFERMRDEGIRPDAVMYACVLNACGVIGAIEKGEQIHEEILNQGLMQNDIVLCTSLVDMYAKCGAFQKAEHILEGLFSRDAVLWSTVIAGYAQEGRREQALNCFKRMRREGIVPTPVTLLSMLNVCNHLGLVEEGYELFADMSIKYGVSPNLECYTCMLDLFGRAGCLERAVRLVQNMPFSEYSATWHALLGSCWKWGDVSIGRWAFEQAVHVDKRDGPAYVLMANIYAASGMQEDARMIETMRISNKAWIELDARSLCTRSTKNAF